MKPIAEKDDARVITYPTDCTHDKYHPNQSIVDIQDMGIIDTKGLPWTIGSLLQGSQFADTIIEAKNIQGAASLEVD
ncbi:hypothetical protein LX32DRAFT_696836 [Colletotrichum zoysiae]|uniref:Uncharacterized protein n=1 Tax=Colletotrichum zoysiae TaxID=1216348 RepID=A0AAD9M0F0_9PEZI|nr:hypothetical protein LX32DRAFT_696836 [Colletotrichum zoysiae]